MRKLFLTLLAVVTMVSAATAANPKKQSKLDADTQAFRYDIEYVKTVGNGISSVKVWSYSSKAQDALEQSKKNAVHGVIFKGYTGPGSSHAALCKSPTAQEDHADFFKTFFANGGDYMRYVSSVQQGSEEVVKVGKKEYKYGQVVQVNVKDLRKALENAGIIKGLSSGF